MVQAPNRNWLEVLGVRALQHHKSQKVQQVRHGKSNHMTRPKANPKPSPWKKGIFLPGTWRCQKCKAANKTTFKTCQKCGEKNEKL